MRLTVPRNGALAIAGVGIAAALSVATISNPRLGNALRDGISDGLQNVQTVAAMLAERSPGARPEGALVQLKHKRQAALHERALPKIRGPYTPPTAYEALAGPPPVPELVPPEAPLLALGGPITEAPIVSGGGGGSPLLGIGGGGPGGGGGGGVYTPPVAQVTPQITPTPVEAVPEPASWAMMLVGFGLIGRALKRRRAAEPRPARA